MIKYQLVCDQAHEFDAWFRSSADFDVQAADGVLECPYCGSAHVRKAIMAPAIAKGVSRRSGASQNEKLAKVQAAIAEAADKARAYVEKNFDYVGDQFPEQARRIHYGESKERQIYGEATIKEAKELVEEGIEVAPVPAAPKPAADKPDVAGPAIAPKKQLN